MKKSILALSIMATSAAVGAAEFHGALSGMSNAGYVTGNYSEGVLLNPSLGAAYGEKDDFALLFSVGALVSDKDELLDQAEDLADVLDVIDQSGKITLVQAKDVLNRLNNIDGDLASVQLGGNLVVAIPNDFVSLSFIADVKGFVSVTPEVTNEDKDIFNSVINLAEFVETGISKGGVDYSNIDLDAIGVNQDALQRVLVDFNTDDLTSEIQGRGAIITDLGVSFAKSFNVKGGELLVGVKPKKTEVKSLYYTATVNNYDEDDFDADDYTVTDSTANLDLGLTYIRGNVRYGFVVNNVKEATFKTINPNDFIKLERQMITSVGYTQGNFKAELAADLNAVEVPGLNGESQFVRAGIEYSAWDWLRVRAGLAQDLKDTQKDTYSIGLGVGAFNIAYVTGDEDTQGVVFSGGIRF